MNKYAKENISTKQPPTREETRVSSKNGDKEWTRRFETSPSERTQAINRSALLRFSLPKAARLLKSAEYRKVYADGKRFDGRLITVFVLPSDSKFQRVGITASKKGIGKAFERNRAKRLLRESFRLSKTQLIELNGNYDWVINARRGLLKVKLDKALQDFQAIVRSVKNREAELTKGESDITIEAQRQ